ncbi:MAG: hypothetical protein ABI175_23780, partial [Polyangiales bacterium]
MYRWGLVAALFASACGGKKDKPAADAAPVVSTPARDAAATSARADAVAASDGAVGDVAGPPPAPTGVTSKVLQVVVRGTVGCARRADGRVRCWGRQRDGKTAPIATAPVELPNVTTAVSVDISPSGAIYVVTSDGHALSTFAELTKLGPLDETSVSGEAVEVRLFGTEPLVLMRSGDLEGPVKSSPRLTDVVAVRTAGTRAFALHRDGHVSAFTHTSSTVLEGLTDIETLIGFGCGRHRGGGLSCWDDRGKPSAWKGPTNVIDRVAGDHISCDLASSGVACVGWNDVGQLGTGPGPDRATPKLVDLPGKAIEISVGARSACAVLDTGDVACWGANDAGQLGDGTLTDRAKPVIIEGLTSAQPVPPSDGRKAIQQASAEMSWAELGEGCKQPTTLAGPDGHTLATIASAYAYVAKGSATLWFGDYRLEPEGYRAGGMPARQNQHAFELRLTASRAIDRGRYRDSGPRRATLLVHDENGAQTFAKGIDLVIERADTTWICG